MSSFDTLVNKAFSLNKVDEAIIVTKNQYKNYFQAISKHFGGNGTYHVEKFGEVSMPTPKGTITFYFDTHEKNENILVLTAVKVGDKKENISLNLTSIKDIALLNNLDNEVDRLFNKPKEKVKSTFVAPTFSVEKVERDFSVPAKAVKISNPDKFVANIQSVWGISHDSDVDIDEGEDGTFVITFDNLDQALKFASIVIIIKHFCLVAAYGWTQDSHEKEIIDVEHVSSPAEFVKSLELKNNSSNKGDPLQDPAFTKGIPPKGALEIKNYKDFADRIKKYKFPEGNPYANISQVSKNVIRITIEDEDASEEFESIDIFIVNNKLTEVSALTTTGEATCFFSPIGDNIDFWIKNVLFNSDHMLYAIQFWNRYSKHSYFFNLFLKEEPQQGHRKYKPETKKELRKLCDNLSVNLGDIDTSLITDMSYLFEVSERTNDQFEGIETWDVSNVEDMYGMFLENQSFNRPLEKWNVSNVKNMACMFLGAESFNQPLEKWDVSNVKDMDRMFCRAESFNQPLEKWDVSNVENMQGMFSSESFNHPLNSWNVSNVRNMAYMFYQATSFNQPLDKWDVSNVRTMKEMFNEARSFNQNISSWDVRKVQTCYRSFDDCPIKEEYKPKFKTNESRRTTTINGSVTVFGKLLGSLNS